MHFGAQFEQAETNLEPTPVAHAKGLICEKISYRASITAKKDKDGDALKECITWRQGEHDKELQRKRMEEEKRRIE